MKRFILLTKFLFVILVMVMFAVIYGGSSYVALNSKPKIQAITSPIPNLNLQKFAYLNNKDFNFSDGDVLGASSGENTYGEHAKSVLVLYYHGITETENEEDIQWDTFKDQMFALKENGYRTISIAELEGYLLNREPLPAKSFLLTFDDGRRDSYYPVDPILKVLDYRAVMFVITSTFNQKGDYHLTASELEEMLASRRWELQSHSRYGHSLGVISADGTTGHWLANKLWLPDENRLETDQEYRQRVYVDLLEAKQDLESTFNIPVNSFAIPFGDYGQGKNNHPEANSVLLDQLKSIYKFIFYQPWDKYGNRNYPGIDTFMIKRIGVEPYWSADDLIETVKKSEDKNFDYIDSFESDKGWIRIWGNATITNSKLVLSSLENTSGATAYLDGTELWADYQLTVKAVLGDATGSFSILTRINREGDYAYCTFSKNGISYNERVNGEIVKGNTWQADFSNFFQLEITGEIKVEGDQTTCILNQNKVVKDETIRLNHQNGMIGLSIWGPEDGKAFVNIHEIKAEPINESVKE
jgi:peptidoglycan/xylan/chitin deacetylase (PgdA/CDA1 family)